MTVFQVLVMNLALTLCKELHPSHLFLLIWRYQEIQITFIIDTGATVTLMSEEVLPDDHLNKSKN